MTKQTFIVVPTDEAFDYWIERLCFYETEYAYDHADELELTAWFDRWMVWLCGELLDGTDIQYMFHDTLNTAMRLTGFDIPFRRIDEHGDDLPAYSL